MPKSRSRVCGSRPSRRSSARKGKRSSIPTSTSTTVACRTKSQSYRAAEQGLASDDRNAANPAQGSRRGHHPCDRHGFHPEGCDLPVAPARPVAALGACHVRAGAVSSLGSGQGSDLGARVEIALLVLAVSAGAPLLPRKLMKIGDGAYIFSLVVTSSLLAILVVPAWL